MNQGEAGVFLNSRRYSNQRRKAYHKVLMVSIICDFDEIVQPGQRYRRIDFDGLLQISDLIASYGRWGGESIKVGPLFSDRIWTSSIPIAKKRFAEQVNNAEQKRIGRWIYFNNQESPYNIKFGVKNRALWLHSFWIFRVK